VAAEWLKAIHARAQECLDKLKTRQPKSHTAIQQAALARTTAYLPAGAAASSGQHPDVYVRGAWAFVVNRTYSHPWHKPPTCVFADMT